MRLDFFRRFSFPKSLRWQFRLALLLQTVFIITGASTAIYGLYVSSSSTRHIADEHLTLLHQSQELVQTTLLIERQLHQMANAESIDALQTAYLDILSRLDFLDTSILALGRASNSPRVLTLHRVNQLFRNTIHTVVQLQKNRFSEKSDQQEKKSNRQDPAKQKTILQQLTEKLQRQVVLMVDSSHDLSSAFTTDHQEMMQRLNRTVTRGQTWVISLLFCSILLAWLVSRFFLGRRILNRLQQMSDSLRIDKAWREEAKHLASEDDEIGEMAGEINRFFEERRLLIRTRHDLKEKEELLAAVIEAAPVAIIGIDLDGHVQWIWNQTAEKMLGWCADEAMGRPLPTVQVEKTEEFRQFREQIRKGLTLNGVEVQRKRRDGTSINYSIYASPLHDFNGEITGNIAVLVDIAERKKMTDQLKKTNEDLKRSNAELEQFAYVASHDLQEPLRKVGSYMELIAMRYGDQLDQDGKEFIHYAVDGSRRMKVMIDDLLTYSRIGTKGKPFAPVAMEKILQNVLEDLELLIRENDAEISYDSLPVVMADDSQLQQLFRNLIGNAVKYRREIPPRIRIRAERQETYWQLFVQDNGIGIDSRFHDRIFLIFQRLHSIEKYNGTGIGLAVCKKIIDRHGGTIGVESIPEEGSTFHFTLPAVEEKENEKGT